MKTQKWSICDSVSSIEIWRWNKENNDRGIWLSNTSIFHWCQRERTKEDHRKWRKRINTDKWRIKTKYRIYAKEKRKLHKHMGGILGTTNSSFSWGSHCTFELTLVTKGYIVEPFFYHWCWRINKQVCWRFDVKR